MTYQLLLRKATNRAIWQQYCDFSDWYARLNTLLNPGSKLPFARLAVNAALARHEAIPDLRKRVLRIKSKARREEKMKSSETPSG